MINKIRFALGLRVVVPCLKGYIVTRKWFFVFRECLDKDGGYWWSARENWKDYCIFPDEKTARAALKCFV